MVKHDLYVTAVPFDAAVKGCKATVTRYRTVAVTPNDNAAYAVHEAMAGQKAVTFRVPHYAARGVKIGATVNQLIPGVRPVFYPVD